MTRVAILFATALLLTGADWLDPQAKARDASRLYEKGDFDAAAQKYNEALTDDPDSEVLHYNLGASIYRQGQYEEAAAAFARTPSANPYEIAYAIGNAQYRLGAAAEASDPEKALGLYAEALAAYRRAMGANPDDVDAKFNHELVEKKVAELKKKIEEQQQNQEKQNQEKQNQEKQNQQPQDPQQQEAGDQPKDEQEKQQPQQGEQQPDQDPQAEQQPQPGETQPPAGSQQQDSAGAAAERRDGEMSEREAQALLDAARDQEVRPEEMAERMQGAAVLEPTEDW